MSERNPIVIEAIGHLNAGILAPRTAPVALEAAPTPSLDQS